MQLTSTYSQDTILTKALIDGLGNSNEASIPSEFCYNDEGSKLFQKLCGEDAYYLSRVERRLLARNATKLNALFSKRTVLELGAGDCSKVADLVAILGSDWSDFSYVANDINAQILSVGHDYFSSLNSRAEMSVLAGDYYFALNALNGITTPDEPRAVLFLGSTIGNFEPNVRIDFLRRIRASLRSGDVLVLGCDLFKDLNIVNAAYNGGSGLIRQMEFCSLAYINKIYKGDFQARNWSHFCLFNPTTMYVESRMFSFCEQQVTLSDLDLRVEFSAGQSILMDRMWKPTLVQLTHSVEEGGFEIGDVFIDQEMPYAIVVGRVS